MAILGLVVDLAPRYDPRILAAIAALDDPVEPMAEIARRVGRVAAELGLPKPSYVHLRRYIRAYRTAKDAEVRRRREIRTILEDAYIDAMRGKIVDAYSVAERIRDPG